MNERIRELAQQAGFMVGTDIAEDKDTSEAFEKFAELIVKECSKCYDGGGIQMSRKLLTKLGITL